MFKELSEEIIFKGLMDCTGQTKRICDRLQILSSVYRVQKRESFKLRLYAWEDRRW